MTDDVTIKLLAPEIVLIGIATLIYLAGAFARPGFRPLGFALLGLFGAAVAMLATRDLSGGMLAYPPETMLSGPLVMDLFGHTARWGILIAGGLLVLLADRPREERQAAEYTGSLLLIIAGLMLAATANDLVLLFMGLELVSIPTYVVLYLGKRGPAAQEATTKYFFLSVLSSAVLLYGFSFLYGLGGSSRLDIIAGALREQYAEAGSLGPFASVALILVFAALAFRLAAVPFHFYAPDVFHGTSNANAGLLSTLPKAAGLVVLIRLLLGAMPGIEPLAWKLALVVSVLTMTLGNVVALWQSNIRRLLAYSSIAHAGYMLIGLSVGLAQVAIAPSAEPQEAIGVNGIGTALFYLAVYAVATLGTFAALAYLSTERKSVDDLDELAGLSQTHPFIAGAIAVFMFSLAGIPPLAGFWGKFALFSGTIDLGAPVGGDWTELQQWFFALAIIGVANAAIAAAYYLRIVATMYFRSPETAAAPVPAARPAGVRQEPEPALATAMALVLVIGMGIFPGRVIDVSDAAGAAVSAATPIHVGESLRDSASLLEETRPRGAAGEAQ
ncbi:MAG: NADH-quinone oxidoreductase subunit N [Pirellulales bacterium]